MAQKNVTIYTTPTCSYCRLAKAFFKEKGVAYQEYDVLADLARRQEMVDKSGQMGVPVIAIGDSGAEDEQVIIGFDRGGLTKALGI